MVFLSWSLLIVGRRRLQQVQSRGSVMHVELVSNRSVVFKTFFIVLSNICWASVMPGDTSVMSFLTYMALPCLACNW